MRCQYKRTLTALGLGTVLVMGAAAARAHPHNRSGDDCPTEPGLLSLRVDDLLDPCLQPGEQVVVTLAMSCLELPVSGYQAFLEFDSTTLLFVEGSYVLPDPFGIPLEYPIAADGNHIGLAAGINPIIGQQPTTADADLAYLTFEALEVEGTTRVRFRDHNPPTLLSGAAGGVVPALLDTPVILVTTCPFCRLGDLDCDDDVDADDFGIFVDCLAGPNVTNPPPGCNPTDFANADLDADSDVDLADFSLFQASFSGL
ncbi:MAG: hypothetical protein KAY37_03375 [Phycisphaerae bacterium]|nr:hypothetical protein [Phycisphaerae bacterium]